MRKCFCCYCFLILFAGLGGCTTGVHMYSRNGRVPFHGSEKSVYVINPEMIREHEILKASGIYELSNDPEGAVKLKLLPIGHPIGCGNPMISSVLTLGLIPVALPGYYSFNYDLEADGVVQNYTHILPLYDRFSIWESLRFANERKSFAKALAWSVLLVPPSNNARPDPHDETQTIDPREKK